LSERYRTGKRGGKDANIAAVRLSTEQHADSPYSEISRLVFEGVIPIAAHFSRERDLAWTPRGAAGLHARFSLRLKNGYAQDDSEES
jgi:hypothetical protein